jgi:hypothetical protein
LKRLAFTGGADLIGGADLTAVTAVEWIAAGVGARVAALLREAVAVLQAFAATADPITRVATRAAVRRVGVEIHALSVAEGQARLAFARAVAAHLRIVAFVAAGPTVVGVDVEVTAISVAELEPDRADAPSRDAFARATVVATLAAVVGVDVEIGAGAAALGQGRVAAALAGVADLVGIAAITAAATVLRIVGWHGAVHVALQGPCGTLGHALARRTELIAAVVCARTAVFRVGIEGHAVSVALDAADRASANTLPVAAALPEVARTSATSAVVGIRGDVGTDIAAVDLIAGADLSAGPVVPRSFAVTTTTEGQQQGTREQQTG